MILLSTQNGSIQLLPDQLDPNNRKPAQLNTHRSKTGFVQLDFMQNPVCQQQTFIMISWYLTLISVYAFL